MGHLRCAPQRWRGGSKGPDTRQPQTLLRRRVTLPALLTKLSPNEEGRRYNSRRNLQGAEWTERNTHTERSPRDPESRSPRLFEAAFSCGHTCRLPAPSTARHLTKPAGTRRIPEARPVSLGSTISLLSPRFVPARPVGRTAVLPRPCVGFSSPPCLKVHECVWSVAKAALTRRKLLISTMAFALLQNVCTCSCVHSSAHAFVATRIPTWIE